MANNPSDYINKKVGVAADNTVSARTIDGRFDRAGGTGQGKYDVSEMVYPNDLLSNTAPYGYNYVVFYINVAEDTRPVKGVKQQTVDDIDPRVASQAQEAQLNAASAGFGVYGQNAVIGGIAGAINTAVRYNSPFRGIAKGQMPAILGTVAQVGVVATQTNTFSRSKKRLKKAIMLHMPNDFKTEYSVSWGEVDLKNFMLGAQGSEALGNIAVGVKDMVMTLGSQEAQSKIGNAVRQGGADLAALALSAPTSTGLQSVTGMAPNPKKEMIFNAVNFRRFTMHYQFFPRNEVEANKVQAIIQQFKYHMHPEYKDAKKFLYLYPSEFDIKFYHRDQENTNLNKITSCILENVSVDYTPNGVFNSLDGGMPPQINVTLAFRELATLTKETIEQGY